MDIRSKARVIPFFSVCIFLIDSIHYADLFFFLAFWIYVKQTLNRPVSDPQKLPKWNYDGSSTGQASGEDSEVIL